MKYEVEVKSLIAGDDEVAKLVNKLQDRGAVFKTKNSQLNHYFDVAKGEDIKDALGCLLMKLKDVFTDDEVRSFQDEVERGEDFSIRSRKKNNEVIFVMKIPVVDGGNSTNGILRSEFEKTLDMEYEELDNLLLECGFLYQSKWSRERKEYLMGDFEISIDKNSGYGYLCEIELGFDDENGDECELHMAKNRIYELMEELDIDELPQDRLDRMFEYYSDNYEKYYGSDKIFEIK